MHELHVPVRAPEHNAAVKSLIRITTTGDPDHPIVKPNPSASQQSFRSLAMPPLPANLKATLISCASGTAVLASAAMAHPILITTQSAAFLRDCGHQSPATVSSISSGCPNRERGLVGSGSRLEQLQTVHRSRSGMKGLWYQVRIVENSTASQTASTHAQAGTIGWLRANAF